MIVIKITDFFLLIDLYIDRNISYSYSVWIIKKCSPTFNMREKFRKKLKHLALKHNDKIWSNIYLGYRLY